ELENLAPVCVRAQRAAQRRDNSEVADRTSVLEAFGEHCVQTVLLIHNVIATRASGRDRDTAPVERSAPIRFVDEILDEPAKKCSGPELHCALGKVEHRSGRKLYHTRSSELFREHTTIEIRARH